MKRHRLFLTGVFVLLSVSLALSGCCCHTYKLGKAKEHWGKGDYAWVAQQDICCKESDEGCNQFHLIKGDACYRLASKGVDAEKNYQCAAEQLEVGIQQTKTWQMEKLDLKRAQTYENLCKVLVELQTKATGERYGALTKRLQTTATRFLEAEPGNPAARYFLSRADYTDLRDRCLIDKKPCPNLCADLQRIQGALEQIAPQAAGTEFQGPVDRLLTEMRATKARLTTCP